MREWVDIAYLANTRNLNGGLVARSAAGLPFLLSEGLTVALVPPRLDAPRRVRVASVQMRSDDEAVVLFDEVTDAATAQALVGCHCLAPRDDFDPADLVPEELPSWEGWTVVDEAAGEVGAVSSLEELPQQVLLAVARPGGSEALIPLVDEFVVTVDEDARRIDVRLPAGLLDL
ncbi:MAG: 16S rRNA processing protein RimM [Eggerthellaceae bacterium]|nr:16S rRNA processing protein RimM [Eggerthellaceae bacterium]